MNGITQKSFSEIAEQLTYGLSIFHKITSKHAEKDCLAWQQGIRDFAQWLDDNGFVVVTAKDQRDNAPVK